MLNILVIIAFYIYHPVVYDIYNYIKCLYSSRTWKLWYKNKNKSSIREGSNSCFIKVQNQKKNTVENCTENVV